MRLGSALRAAACGAALAVAGISGTANADYDVAVAVQLNGYQDRAYRTEQGRPSNCTRDESYGQRTVPPRGVVVLRMVAKTGGSCMTQGSYNAWKFTLGDGTGTVEVSKEGVHGEYVASCHDDWKGPRCSSNGFVMITARWLQRGTRAAAERHCTISGGDGDDVLRGTPGDDVVCGFGGDDTLIGGGGDDLLVGGPGADRLIGGAGADTAFGNGGRDRFTTDRHDRAGDAARGELVSDPG